MPLSEKRMEDGALIGIWEIEESESRLAEMLPDPSLYEEQLAVLVNERRRVEYLAIRVLLCELTGEEKCVGYHPSGKPYLIDASYQVSISHTHGWAAVILHPTRRVAIDIERINDRAKRLRERFLNENELLASPEGFSEIYAVLCWSAKESLYKRIDYQGADFRDELHLERFEMNKTGIIGATADCPAGTYRGNIRYEIDHNCVLTYIMD